MILQFFIESSTILSSVVAKKKNRIRSHNSNSTYFSVVHVNDELCKYRVITGPINGNLVVTVDSLHYNQIVATYHL